MPYDGKNIKDLNILTPGEGSSYIPELNDSDREIKRVLKNQFAIAVKTSNYTLTENDFIIICESAITITLPPASSVAGSGYTKRYLIINKSSGQVIISGVVDGQSNPTIPSGYSMMVQSDGSYWYAEKPYLSDMMRKSIYDADGDELVDNSKKLDGKSADTSATADTIAVRDSNARLKAADPVAGDDVATKNYVDNYGGAANKLGYTDFKPKNTYVIPISIIPGNQTRALTNIAVYFIPFLVPETITIDRIAFYVSTIDSGSNIGCWIYSATDDGWPDQHIVGGVVSTSTTGLKTIDITGGRTLNPGRYYFAITSDRTPSLMAVQVAYALIGIPTAATINTTYTMYSFDYNWGNNEYERPAPNGQSMTPITGYVPFILLRRSA